MRHDCWSTMPACVPTPHCKGIAVIDDNGLTGPNRGEQTRAPIAPVGPFQPWRLLLRLPMLLVGCLIGLPLLLATLLPGLRAWHVAGQPVSWRTQRWVARWLVASLGMRLEVRGTLPPAPFLLVSNHISWFDIPLLHTLEPIWLVAKADIRTWPLVGALANAVGTIFIARGSEVSRRRAARRMTALLKRGRCVGVFPEAGISAKLGVDRFHARLFGPAQRAGVPVLPVAIRYWRDGDLHYERVFAPGVSFLGLMMSNLGRPPCIAQVLVGRPIPPQGLGRSELARRARQQIMEMYASEHR